MRYVLFVCNHNAGRSQMAQSFFERLAPPEVRAESAGQEPAKAVWPNVVAAMREIGVDLSRRRPKKLTIEMQLHADWAVTMACGESCPYVPTTVEDWEIPDPAGRPIDEVRVIRDEIETRVTRLVHERIDQIRNDRTAHQFRLVRLLPQLVTEFEAVRSPEEIRACADAILDDYDDVPVRSHIMTLARKRTRDCLREETCTVVGGAASRNMSDRR